MSSTSRVSRDGNRHSQLGRACSLFLLKLSVCSLSSAFSDSGKVLIPVESTMRTRRDVSLERNSGRARIGFEAMFSSSRFKQAARAGGKAPRKFAEISRASRVLAMVGKVLLRKDGTLFGVLDEPISKWVVPGNVAAQVRLSHSCPEDDKRTWLHL